jgi:hypothetical protein
MATLGKLVKVSEAITIHRYDNGWMVEISGRNKNDDWASTKRLCNTEAEVFDLVKEYNSIPLEQ